MIKPPTPNQIIQSDQVPKCQNPNCASTTTSANFMFKACHYCYTFYCSRQCRQIDWYEHKSFKCFYGRLSSFCKKILTKVGRQCLELRCEISKIARASYVNTRNKRGFVWLDFASGLEAQQFIFKPLNACKLSNFLIYFGDHLLPKYVCKDNAKIIKQLFPDENQQIESDFKLFEELCKAYDPLTELILLVSIKINENDHDYLDIKASETALPRKHAPINTYVLKFMKMKFFFGKDEAKVKSVTVTSTNLVQREIPDDLPLTLILTSLGNPEDDDNQNRQLFMANLLNEFQMRGIKIREKYPKIYRDLCLYVEENRPFTPCCLFPRDLNKNNLFMCLIMPDSEPTNFTWLYENEVQAKNVTDETGESINNKVEDENFISGNVKNVSFNLSQYLWIR